MQKSEVSLSGGMLTVLPLPELVAQNGTQGKFAWEEYFAGRISNAHTRKSYLHAVKEFLNWAKSHGVENLQQITPGMVGTYFSQHLGSPATKKQHMSATRGFLDVLVLRHVLMLNPAHSVNTERFSVMEGKTPEITVEQARSLLASISLDCVVGYRDRAIIAVLAYTAARVGAIASPLRMKFMIPLEIVRSNAS